MTVPDIALVNRSTSVSDKALRQFARAMAVQLKRDFLPAWGRGAKLHCIGRKQTPRAGIWQVVFVDDRNSAEGYHELTSGGFPLGRIFVREANEWPSGWTGTASHEILELLMDPDTTFGVLVEDESKGPRVYSLEVCDPVQADRFSYAIDGVALSNFVTPAWFQPWQRRSRSVHPVFDHARKLRAPFQVPAGGYAMFYDVRRRLWLDN
jgi:hypothetical protein